MAALELTKDNELKLKEIFDGMKYEDETSYQLEEDEILIKPYLFNYDDDNIPELHNFNWNVDRRVQRQSMHRLTKEIEQNVETFIQIENKYRPNIPSKDTRKSVRLLKEYFNYYATFIPRKPGGLSVDGSDHSETATFRFTIDNFSKLKKYVQLPTFFVQNLPWKLLIWFENNSLQCSARLECHVNNKSKRWTCHATAELRLLMGPQKVIRCIKTVDHLFSSDNSQAFFDGLNPDSDFMACTNAEIILELEIKAHTPNGILLNNGVAIVIDENYPLWTLGMSLAPALAAGAVIFIHAEPAISHVIKYLLQLCKNVGIFEEGKENIFLILYEHLPSESFFFQRYSSYFNHFILLQNIPNPTLCRMTQGFEILKEKKLILALNSTSMVVYDDADLNSAVECIIDAAWKPRKWNPCAVDKIFVQENVFQIITEKLKNKLKIIAINNQDKYGNVEITFQDNCETKQPSHLEIYHRIYYSNGKPVLNIGSKYGIKSESLSNDYDYFYILLTPFKSKDESVHLVNKTGGIGVSVWSQKVRLIDELTSRLETNNVWVNSYGLFSPEVSFTAFKNNGVGYFGGVEGFDEFYFTPLVTSVNDLGNRRSSAIIEELDQAVIKSKNSYAAWSRYSFVKKKKIFQDIQEYVEDYINKCSSMYESLAETLEDTWKSKPSSCFTINGYNVMALKEPRGALVIEFRRHTEIKYLKLLLTALWEGNAVILLNEATENESFYNEISQRLPPNIFSVFPYNPSTVYTASRNKQIDGYFGVEYDSNFDYLDVNELKHSVYLNQVANISNSVVKIKTIWTDIGQSSNFN